MSYIERERMIESWYEQAMEFDIDNEELACYLHETPEPFDNFKEHFEDVMEIPAATVHDLDRERYAILVRWLASQTAEVETYEAWLEKHVPEFDGSEWEPDEG